MTKKLRFEVFKRDSFTCLYCGRKPPDVVLQVDHINPVSKGGSDELINLVTSCFDCNMGKSDRELSDDTVVRIQTAAVEDSKKRAVVVREKKAQLQEYLEWKKEVESLLSHEIEALQELWGKLTETSLTEVGLSSLQKTVKKHGFNKVYDAIKDSCERHLRLSSKDGLTYTRPSCEKALSKISSTIMWTDKWKDNPHLEKIHYIKGILRNRFTISWADQSKLVEMMEVSRVDGTDLITMQECAVFCKSLEEFMEEML